MSVFRLLLISTFVFLGGIATIVYQVSKLVQDQAEWMYFCAGVC